MEYLPYLPLPVVIEGLPKKKGKGFPRDGKKRDGTERADFSIKVLDETDKLIRDLSKWKDKYGDAIDPALIFKIEANSNINEKDLGRMGLKVLGVDYKDAVVVFANDDHLIEFRRMVEEYSGEIPATQKDAKNAFIHTFDDVCKIMSEDKKGIRLKKEPLQDGEIAELDIELWHMGIDYKKQLLNWKKDVDIMLNDSGGTFIDEYLSRELFIIRAKVPSSILDDILELGQVARVDRPPKNTMNLSKLKGISLDEIGDITSPEDDDPGILVVDSGIISGHPLLKSAIGDAQSFIEGKMPIDEAGHGTAVAGIALYGNLEKYDKMEFNQGLWIYSARICDENGDYDHEKLLENRLHEAIKYFIDNYDNIRVVNLSIGDTENVYKRGEYQFKLAAFIDELAFDYKDKKLLFVISAGNYDDGETIIESLDEKTGSKYPNYLIDDPRVKIIDPSTSALALTVGSLSLGQGSEYRWFSQALAGYEKFPSPFTRTGPGINDMIKPDLVEFGGDLSVEKGSGIVVDSSIGVITTGKDFLTEGLFIIENGTSFSAAKVSHLAAKLWRELPDASSNLIRALLVASATIPDVRPRPLDNFKLKTGSVDEQSKLLSIYGYGIPEFDRAFSYINRALLIDEREIKLNNIVVYEIPIPVEFLSSGNGRMISVTLAFDPLTRMRRKQYCGATMIFHLFRGVDAKQITQKYAEMDEFDMVQGNTPASLAKNEVKLIPGASLVKNGTVQKKMWVIDGVQKITDDALKLVVICSDKWIDSEEYRQNYAIVVTVEQREMVELYNKIKNKIRIKERIKV